MIVKMPANQNVYQDMRTPPHASIPWKYSGIVVLVERIPWIWMTALKVEDFRCSLT